MSNRGRSQALESRLLLSELRARDTSHAYRSTLFLSDLQKSQ